VAREGRLHVRPERPGAKSRTLPRLVADVEPLATILAGTLSPVRAAEGGLVEDTRGAAALIEPWFRARPVFLHPMNAF
jgi:hypothetical protein